MRKFELIAPCYFGTESVLKREIIDLGYDVTEVSDGRVTFLGDEEALCRANVFPLPHLPPWFPPKEAP